MLRLIAVLLLGLASSPSSWSFVIGIPGGHVVKVSSGRGRASKVFRAAAAAAAGSTAPLTAPTATQSPPLAAPSTDDYVMSPHELANQAARLYKGRFGQFKLDEAAASFAPGRVNLIGEHTDYNGGFVMPLALQHGTAVFGIGGLENVGDGHAPPQCIVISDRVPEEAEFAADASLAPGEPRWANLVKGVVAQYLQDVPAGKALRFRASVSGTVPLGGGVSSSASLTVAVATFLEEILAKSGVASPSPTEKALRCQRAEHIFALTPCGIMDQFVSSLARPGHAMLLDCRSNEPRAVPLADDDLCILVTNSNVVHSLSERGSQYPVRVRQCAEAVEAIRRRNPAVRLLRDATQAHLDAARPELDETVFRRARHVISENDRCLATADALAAHDYATVGRYMLDSHRSLRDDYEVSCPELDLLVRLAMEVNGVYGCRLTGAGFGGCVVTLVRRDSVARLAHHLQDKYQQETGVRCQSFITQPGAGAHALPVDSLLQ